jgi:hypothetical protein
MTHIIVGGGAAGIFAAIRCKEKNPESSVILLEKTNQLLSKVRVSGGGRCNVTHACFDPKELVGQYPRGRKELLGPYHFFQPRDTVAWFEKRGVELKTEGDGRMFPTTDSSETIIQCLLDAAEGLGVDIRRQQKIQSIQKLGTTFSLTMEKGPEILADTLLLATGSTPWGWEIAKQFGHRVIDPVPSLFTFNVPTSPLLDLSGISVPNARLTVKEAKLSQQGPLLLTHWGFSGPTALKLSAWAARELHALDYKAILLINWTGAESQEALLQLLLKQKLDAPLQPFPALLPAQLLARLLSPLKILPMGKLSHQALSQIAAKLYADAYRVEGKTTYKQEFVTAGGIRLSEVSFKTMESKITGGLYFAGEILDVDGVTGGFNFQNAWTTGWLAGSAMAKLP